MFIAELDGQQVGIIHVVEKKQKTVKISPLIVSSTYRGKLGIGNTLLEHAENFARSIGARQLYCTVASPNQKALEFFLRKGFRITGTLFIGVAESDRAARVARNAEKSYREHQQGPTQPRASR